MDVEVICVDDEDGEIFSQEAQEQQPLVSAVVDLTNSSPASAEAASFEQEYHVLRSAARGFEPPLEAIAELMLRHPKHWWCRYVYCTTHVADFNLQREKQRGIMICRLCGASFSLSAKNRLLTFHLSSMSLGSTAYPT